MNNWTATNLCDVTPVDVKRWKIARKPVKCWWVVRPSVLATKCIISLQSHRPPTFMPQKNTIANVEQTTHHAASRTQPQFTSGWLSSKGVITVSEWVVAGRTMSTACRMATGACSSVAPSKSAACSQTHIFTSHTHGEFFLWEARSQPLHQHHHQDGQQQPQCELCSMTYTNCQLKRHIHNAHTNSDQYNGRCCWRHGCRWKWT